jgi:O-antigen/teichoic acid export membrane protein
VAGLGLVLGAAEPITAVLLGEQWRDVPPLLRLLALAGIFQTLAFVGYWVYLSRGLSGQLLRYSLVQAAIRVVCIVGGSTWGVVGVAAGYALAPALGWPLSFWWLSRHAPIPVRELVSGALRVLTLALAVAGSAWLAADLVGSGPPAAQLALSVGAGVLAYVVLVGAVAALRRDFRAVQTAVSQGMRRRRPSTPHEPAAAAEEVPGR